MRQIINLQNCSGCGACYNKCPVGAIEMKSNEEGFLYPEIDNSKCTNCGLCEKTCPALNQNKEVKSPVAYAAQASDEIRYNSSSGGVFTLLANYIFENDGYVCGASYNNDFSKVEHIIISSKEDLHKLQTSKYLQSNTKTVYKEIKNLLDKGKLVLFTGTPCQVQGLNYFLNKNYEKLFTADIICHGAPSPGVWSDYIKTISNGKKIKNVNFRDKKYGWKSPLLLSIDCEDERYEEYANKDIYFKSFLKNLILRKSCGTCLYANLNRPSDITLGDFWKVHKYNKSFDDKKGTSLVIVNSQKGNSLLEAIKKELILLEEVPIKAGIRGNKILKKPSGIHKNREQFFLKYKKGQTENLENLMTDALEDNLKYDGIITNLWHNCNNYGAILTAYALQQYFKERKLDYRLLNFVSKKNKVTKSTKELKKFINKHLVLTHPIYKYSELQDLNYITDNFVVGSDQVFRDHCIRKYKELFTLCYTDFSKKRVAFSASFGKDSFDMDNIDKYIISKYLKRFDSISVREESGVKFSKELFDVDAKHIIDPVFLVNKDAFAKLVDTNMEKYKDKIVYYVLDSSKKIQEKLKNLSADLDTEIVNITYQPLTIEEFLSAIYNCKYLITDSFHGSCFAILFHKNFLGLKNEDRGAARFNSLIKTFNLNNCFVGKSYEITAENVKKVNIDWQDVEKRLADEKLIAEDWFKEVFLTPKKVTTEQLINEADFAKNINNKDLYKNRKKFRELFFSVQKNDVRTTLCILGIKLKIKRK